ncbi:glycoside hydrolase family 32 protein [Trinickia sp.]|uniref:glycoside hydrolase family 32 protein n=1 Tax=Trinickia sp. TaxID=2571163 RepID=UPI003F816F30
MKRRTTEVLLATLFSVASAAASAQTYNEPFRPQFHFSPARNWMNDPNGLLFYNGKFNLFFQYNPNGITWGDMSWGHATSPDLFHWSQLPDALDYTVNANGQTSQMFFSGSAVADVANTSGFGTAGHPPLVAIYASYYPIAQTLANGTAIQAGQQAQSIAYSLDEGKTWAQYAGNPVIALPPAPYQSEYQNFRDPKVFWYAPGKKWVMVVSLAALHKIALFSSADLKHWAFMSEFGPANAIGGVWECPDLFPLPVDGNPHHVKWVLMVGINPGALQAGSGTQYFVGDFDGTRFTADDIIDTLPPPGSTVFQNFEAPSFAAMGWTAAGALRGLAPATAQPNEGAQGNQLLDTFAGSDSATGTLTSPPFKITKSYIDFLIAGGYHPYDPSTYGTSADTETAVNLLIDGKVVMSTTGTNSGHLGWRNWDVRGYRGRTASIQVVDHNTGAQNGWGHIMVDDFVFSDVPQNEAHWLDYGPDYYAAASWNGLDQNDRFGIGWMNNWSYGGNIPTSPWRSAMSVPRQYALRTIDGQARLVQRPAPTLKSLWQPALPVPFGHVEIAKGETPLPGGASGKTLDISAVFSPGTASAFGLKVRTGANGDETLIGYDTRSRQVFVDRFRSGLTSFDPMFAGRYTAPLTPDADGRIKLRVVVDWSSVEVFAGEGEAVLTAQIFPAATSDGVALFAKDGSATLDSITIHPVKSAWAK